MSQMGLAICQPVSPYFNSVNTFMQPKSAFKGALRRVPNQSTNESYRSECQALRCIICQLEFGIGQFTPQTDTVAVGFIRA